MSTVHSFSEAVQFAARCIECPICKEACVQPVRPKNCPHRYCMRCFRKCFQDKQEKHCATCRTPILSVSKRGFTGDDLFAKVAEIVPGLQDEEDDEEFDIAAIMAKQKQQAAKIREEAVQMRMNNEAEKNARSAKHSGAVQSSSPVHAKKSPPKQQKAAASSPAARHARAKEFVDSSHDRRSSLPPLAVHSALPAHPVASIAVPVSTVTSGAHAATDQQFSGSQEAITGLKPGQTDGSGASTSMNAQFVDTKGILGKGTLPDMHGVGQPAAKRAKVGNTILPAGSHQQPGNLPTQDPRAAVSLAAGSLSQVDMLTGGKKVDRPIGPATSITEAMSTGNELLRESLQAQGAPAQKRVTVYMQMGAAGSTSKELTPVMCDWDSYLANSLAEAAMPAVGDSAALAATIRLKMTVDGCDHDVTLKTAGEAAMLAREHVVVELSGLPPGAGLW